VVVATRYHGVVLSLACGTPVLAVAYQEKTQQVAEHLGVGKWGIDAEQVTGTRLLGQLARLLSELGEARRTIHARNSVDVEPLIHQFDTLATMATRNHPTYAQALR
jgi:polysaccharide pyruvyl transferase WcaK-like protein